MERTIANAKKLLNSVSHLDQAAVDELAQRVVKGAIEAGLVDEVTTEGPMFKVLLGLKTCDEIEINTDHNFKRIAKPAGVIASRVDSNSIMVSSLIRILMTIKSRCAMIFTYPKNLKAEITKIEKLVESQKVECIQFYECSDDMFRRLREHNGIHDFINEEFLNHNGVKECCIRSNLMGRFLLIENEEIKYDKLDKEDRSFHGLNSFNLPARILFKAGCTSRAIFDSRDYKKMFIITDYDTDYSRKTEFIEQCMADNEIKYYKYTSNMKCQVGKDLNNCITALNNNKPNCIVAIGNAEVMSFAKIAKLLYEHPEIKPEEFSERYSDFMRFSLEGIKTCKTHLMTIPTELTSSAITPYAHINIENRYVQVATNEALPNIAIIDPDRVGFSASSAFLEIINGIESICSMANSTYTQDLALHAVKLLLENDPEKNKEAIFNATAIIGMATGSSFYGLTKALAEELYRRYEIPEQATALVAFDKCFKYLPQDKLKEIAKEVTGNINVNGLIKHIKEAATQYAVEPISLYVKKEQLEEEARRIANHTFRNKNVLACEKMPTMKEIELVVRKLM